MAFEIYKNRCDRIQPEQKRKIGPTRRSVSGLYAFRGETSIAFESTLERDFLMKSEFDSNVLSITPQPVQVPFIAANGRRYSYTPDYLVFYRIGKNYYGPDPRPLLVEIKLHEDWAVNWRSYMPKWKAAWRYAQEQYWSFHIYDESRIRDQAMTNIRFFERYKRMQFPKEESQQLVDTVTNMGQSTMDYLLAKHFMGIYRAEGLAHIWHLIATRQLDCDINRPLNNFTEVWIAKYE